MRRLLANISDMNVQATGIAGFLQSQLPRHAGDKVGFVQKKRNAIALQSRRHLADKRFVATRVRQKDLEVFTRHVRAVLVQIAVTRTCRKSGIVGPRGKAARIANALTESI